MNRSWLVIPQRPAAARAQLICFPYAGGGAAVFTGWTRILPDDVQLISIQYPGRHHLLGEPTVTRIEPLANRIADQLAPRLGAALPTVIYGHSMGSLIAFEVLRRLRNRGICLPAQFALGAFSAPHLPFANAGFHLLDDDRFLAAVAAQYEVIPPEILADPEWRRLLLGALRADFELLYYYRFRREEPLPIPFHAFTGIEDHIPRESVAAWSEHTGKRFACEPVVGGHFFFRPNPAPLLDRLLSLLPSPARPGSTHSA